MRKVNLFFLELNEIQYFKVDIEHWTLVLSVSQETYKYSPILYKDKNIVKLCGAGEIVQQFTVLAAQPEVSSAVVLTSAPGDWSPLVASVGTGTHTRKPPSFTITPILPTGSLGKWEHEYTPNPNISPRPTSCKGVTIVHEVYHPGLRTNYSQTTETGSSILKPWSRTFTSFLAAAMLLQILSLFPKENPKKLIDDSWLQPLNHTVVSVKVCVKSCNNSPTLSSLLFL